MPYIFPFIIAFGFAALLTPLIAKFAKALRVVDLPGPRKIHTKPIPLLGGLAVFFAFMASTLIFWRLGYIIDVKISPEYILGIIAGGGMLMVGGYLDDRYRLKPWQQLIFPLLAIAIVIGAGIKIQFVTNPFGGVFNFPVQAGMILAFFWLFGMIYTTKILDGLDGLVSGVTVIGALTIFAVSLYWDIPSSGTSVLALILAGACLGFLIFNWHPAKIFLGEGGSVFCGFMLGVLSIISGSKIATALLIMGIPILDLLWVISRRIWQGASPVAADRKHLHFRLLDIGLSQRQAVIFLYFLTGSFGVTSLFLHSRGKLIALAVLAAIMVGLGLSLVIIYKRKI